MAHGLSNSHVTDDVTWPWRCCEAVRSAILATARLFVGVGTRLTEWRYFPPYRSYVKST